MGTDERRSERSNVLLTATIELGRAHIPVRIRNISEHGALVVGPGLPPTDTPVTFHCNGIGVPSFVAWSKRDSAGIQFDSPIEMASLRERTAAPAAVVKLPRNQDFRRPGFRGNQLTEGERRIVADWHGPGPKRPEEDAS